MVGGFEPGRRLRDRMIARKGEGKEGLDGVERDERPRELKMVCV